MDFKRLRNRKRLKNGNKLIVNEENNDQPHKLFNKAVPRYRSMNMFEENDAPAKREEFVKNPNLSQNFRKGKEKENEMAAGQGMDMYS